MAAGYRVSVTEFDERIARLDQFVHEIVVARRVWQKRLALCERKCSEPGELVDQCFDLG